jgi:hypothetical protein
MVDRDHLAFPRAPGVCQVLQLCWVDVQLSSVPVLRDSDIAGIFYTAKKVLPTPTQVPPMALLEN